ncbi:IS3 family transposase [Vulcanimicrobium alpinum]|uniref:IS3 family transposase n=1 Tax=Vulcanimicrobium alpinum TaxID=3016050 RepID=A0AAN1XW27_UNVUL|nr:IS3 family transposase [Vulcanimicrobium alpinum]BDE06842.1 IS3 family transposase [Vulcanimicrobium alpinum]
MSRSTLRRRRKPAGERALLKTIARRNALSEAERRYVAAVLCCERFADLAVPQVFTRLLDEGTYLCSVSTMYRILRANAQVRERRRLARHPAHEKPRLVANAPRQVLTWDITKLPSSVKGVYFSLLVMIDIFSRYVVGWTIVRRANAEIAAEFIRATLLREGIEPRQAVVHSDRGTEMTAQPVCDLLDKMGVARSYSRPRVSDDNPFIESSFKTLKYQPTFPSAFGSLEDSYAFCSPYFMWYNNEHRHSGIAMLTPAAVHFDQGEAILAARHKTMIAAYALQPHRFAAGAPKLATIPSQVWINESKAADIAA